MYWKFIIISASLCMSLNIGIAQNWSTQGNSTSSSDFIGTTNGTPFVVKTASGLSSLPEERFRIAENGNIGIGSTVPFCEWPSGKILELRGFAPAFHLFDTASSSALTIQSMNGINRIYSNHPIRFSLDSSSNFSVVGNRNPPGQNDPEKFFELLKLNSQGTLYVRGIKVTSDSFPDFIFQKNYQLMPLNMLHDYIVQNGHLPDMPDARTISKEGLDIGKNEELMTRKIEELTLYILQLQAQIDALKKQVSDCNN